MNLVDDLREITPLLILAIFGCYFWDLWKRRRDWAESQRRWQEHLTRTHELQSQIQAAYEHYVAAVNGLGERVIALEEAWEQRARSFDEEDNRYNEARSEWDRKWCEMWDERLSRYEVQLEQLVKSIDRNTTPDSE